MISRKIERLEKLIENEDYLRKLNHLHVDFVSWKEKVERVLKKLFGENSDEYKNFKNRKFCYRPLYTVLGEDYSKLHTEHFRNHLKKSISSIKLYIEEFKEDLEDEQSLEFTTIQKVGKSRISKVFISHSTEDRAIVEEIIELLEVIGLKKEQIFCTSFEGYGIELGENFLKRIKEELDNEVLVLFVLSDNFYNSPVSLCEMGATWIKTNQHIPILIPPFDFKNIKGVIPLTQGFSINEKPKLNSFKKKIEIEFSLMPNDFSTWERKRDRMLDQVNKIIRINNYKQKAP